MEAGRQQMDVAKQHAAAVIAAINAVNAYAEWAPLSDLAKYGIIYGYILILQSFFFFTSWDVLIHSLSPIANSCGFLLSSPDFRLHACEFFKLVAAR